MSAVRKFDRGAWGVTVAANAAMLLALMLMSGCGPRDAGDATDAGVPELRLARAWVVEGPGRFDASGIAIRDGSFFVVSDRHSDTVFRLEFDGASARAVPAVKFSGPEPYPEVGYLDLEGIVLAPDGGFYLASEWGFAVCLVPAGGGTATWATPSLQGAGEAVGLFATKDAFVEGIAMLGDGHFLIAGERQPRGIIEVGIDPAGGAPKIHAHLMEESRFGRTGDRPLDWTDLAVWKGRVFALARNQGLVVELVRKEDGDWHEAGGWSFAATENAPRHRFTDTTFGTAEGLVIDDQYIYVLLDNNALGHESDPSDHRTWLFAFGNVIGE